MSEMSEYVTNMNTKIKDWYVKTYPQDELGEQLNPDKTFDNLFEALDFHNEDIYELLGNGIDSIIRERVFQRLAEILDCDYDEVYQQWLG